MKPRQERNKRIYVKEIHLLHTQKYDLRLNIKTSNKEQSLVSFCFQTRQNVITILMNKPNTQSRNRVFNARCIFSLASFIENVITF